MNIENVENTPESIYRQQLFIEICCQFNTDNRPKGKAELLALYSERITVFIPENCDNIKEIAEKDIENLIKQGFFNAKSNKNGIVYTVNAAIHSMNLKKLEAVAIQSLEQPQSRDNFLI